MKVNEPETTIKVEGIDFELRVLNMDIREAVMDLVWTIDLKKPTFSMMCKVITLATYLKRDDLMNYSNVVIASLFATILPLCDVSSTKKNSRNRI